MQDKITGKWMHSISPNLTKDTNQLFLLLINCSFWSDHNWDKTRNVSFCFKNPGGNLIKILQESCKILIKIKILIRSCLTFKILKNLGKNLVRS